MSKIVKYKKKFTKQSKKKCENATLRKAAIKRSGMNSFVCVIIVNQKTVKQILDICLAVLCCDIALALISKRIWQKSMSNLSTFI